MSYVDSAADLFREIKRRGLELRHGNGRDDALYRQLASRLHVDSTHIQRELDRGHISVEQFVFAFFSILQPFAQMYSDIYAEMQRQGAKRAKESIWMRFDFGEVGGEALEFDLRRFREVMALMSRVRAHTIIQLWGYDDLHKLFEFQRMLESDLPYEHHRDYYRSGHPYQLPPVPPVSEPLYRTLNSVRDVYQQIIDAVAEQAMAEQALDTPQRNLPYLLADLLPGFMIVVSQLRNPTAEQKIGPERIASAVNYFEDVKTQLQQRHEGRTTLIRELLEILNLPMWRQRWYLYEVWASTQVIAGLCEYDAQFVLDGDTLRFEEGRASRVAEFDTATGISVELWAQRQTPVTAIPGRKAIMPDLRLCLPDGDSPESTIVSIEFKQRKSMTRSEVVKLIDLYDVGTPGSVGNFYLNYDAFPEGVEREVAHPDKSYLFGFFNPQHRDHIVSFKRELVRVLRVGGYEPVGRHFDILLLDVSSSMCGEYDRPSVLGHVEQIIKLNPGVKIYFFSTELIDPASTVAVPSLAEINRHLGGGTQLQNALQELAIRHPEARRLLIVTDGAYGTAPSLTKYEEVVECTPLDLARVASQANSQD